MTIFGTRPEAIKMAPIILEMKNNLDEFQPITVLTGQHKEMLDQVMDIFHIEADYNLHVMKAQQT
ncbi:MAG: UDP-N-acetylglucosamine 2-epimerase (non-hydrolyzing), partial [Apilactobacillus kunkeei]|nr:UDP-N-acetylglucosamine 2-epimerase (non-hydrolyzing) [Apilactobacillus kunkeei]